jgi:hypothetical protein
LGVDTNRFGHLVCFRMFVVWNGQFENLLFL